MLAGVMYGCMYYKKKLTLPRVLATKFIVMLVCNVFLNTLCLTVLYGQAFMVILPARALKNLIMWRLIPSSSLQQRRRLRALAHSGLCEGRRRSGSPDHKEIRNKKCCRNTAGI